MRASSVFFKGHLCFQKEWAGFDTTKPINVIIGRNNSGKSHLLDLVEAFCRGKPGESDDGGWQYRCHGVLDEESLKSQFHEGSRSQDLGGDPWRRHGNNYVGVEVTWEIDTRGRVQKVDFPEDFTPQSYGGSSEENRLLRIKEILKSPTHQLNGHSFRKLAADRDIKTEPAENELMLGSDGTGATNIIRRFITSASEQFPRQIVQQEVLEALNDIFENDGHFTEIQVQQHDDEDAGEKQGHWEVYLGEDQKGLISLTNSGSGLKTVILVLLNLLVVPKMGSNEKRKKSEIVFAFEELENNLHPALVRRLFRYLEEYAIREDATIFLTTHSSTVLDLFGMSEEAQIIHITHDGETARTTTVSAQFDHLDIISQLGAKPSDLLQANGIVWVEGPSDRVYLNRWIHICSNGSLREGRDYQCAFYGGGLLARIEFRPSEEETELTNLFRVNPNIVVVCDGDRESKNSRIKGRVKRIREEVKKIPKAHIWITRAREIENYIPGSVLGEVLGLKPRPDPEQYRSFFPRKRARSKSYLELHLGRNRVDKIDLAMQSALHMTEFIMAERFEWKDEMKKVVARIRCWNA